MGFIGPRPPRIGETEEESLKADIEYYEKHIALNRKMTIIMVGAFVVLLIVVIISLTLPTNP